MWSFKRGHVETDKFLNHLYTRKSGLDYQEITQPNLIVELKIFTLQR